MATKITKIQLRRDTKLNWSQVNPILTMGEIGFENDSGIPGGMFKIGDGASPWESLTYFGAGTKGTFDEIVKNGPFADTGFPPGLAPIYGIEGISWNQYAGAEMGIYTNGVISQADIFPSVPDVFLGRNDARFREAMIYGGVHIGEDTSNEVVLTHLPGATVQAKLIVDQVGPGGRVESLVFGRLSNGHMAFGEGYRVEHGLHAYYTNDSAVLGVGHSLRINVDQVDPISGRILNFSVQDKGAGFQSGETVIIELKSQLGLTRNSPFGDGSNPITSELVTIETLRHVTSQSLPLAGSGAPASPYANVNTAALPPFTGQDQGQFNAYTLATLALLDRDKLQIVNCTATAGGEGPPVDGNGDPHYHVIINNEVGAIHPGFGITPAPALKGGEILYFDKGPETWAVVAGGTGGSIDNEEDPVFLASDASRISEVSMAGIRHAAYEGTISAVGPQALMYVNDWSGIPSL